MARSLSPAPCSTARARTSSSQDPTNAAIFVQIGEREVKGVELGIVGKVTDNWELSAGVAKMDTEVVHGNPTQTGAAINWSPELTFSSWTTYRTPFGLTIGGGVRYVDTVARAINNAPLATSERAVGARVLGDRRDGRLRVQRQGVAAAECVQPRATRSTSRRSTTAARATSRARRVRRCCR